jgi:hypothetical protein
MFMLYAVMRFNCNKPISQRRTAWIIFSKKMVKLAWSLLFTTCANLLDFLKTFVIASKVPIRRNSTRSSRPFLILRFLKKLFPKPLYVKPERNLNIKPLPPSTNRPSHILIDRNSPVSPMMPSRDGQEQMLPEEKKEMEQAMEILIEMMGNQK